MPGRILIVDEVATSRIVLKVQLSASFQDIHQAASATSALEMAERLCPDLVLFSDRLPDMTAFAFVARLRESPGGRRASLVALMGESDRTARARILSAGADDVFARSQPQLLLLSRLRCLMRGRGTEEEIRLREDTGHALGLGEAPAAFERPGVVSLVTHRSATALDWHNALSRLSRHRFLPMPLSEALRWSGTGAPADVFAIDLDGTERRSVLRLITDIRSRSEARHAEILLITADHLNPTLADALDLGASAVMPHGFDPREGLLRLDVLLRRKQAAERLWRSLEDGLRASMTDALTGLHNRRYALPHMDRLAANAAARGRDFAVILADLDHFKQVNDHHGHSAGDAVLMAVADLLRDNLRARDLVARFGGEEFLIVMPDTGRAEAQIAADRLRARLEARAIGVPGQEVPIRVTMSMGICVARPKPEDQPTMVVQQMIDAADRALYEAKHSGRNRITLAAAAG